ncbi:MAG: hypothetical protein WBF17_14755 [Phycisphaerae bacterium]
MKRLWCPVSVAAVLMSAVCVSGCRRAAQSPPPQARSAQEQAAADAALRAGFLQRYGLKGRVALIEFGLLGCELSEKGLEEMATLERLGAIPQLAFARVEASQDTAAVDEYYKAKSLKFPVHRDPDAALGRAFDATAYPTFLIVGKFGRVRYRGGQPDNRLEEWVEAILAEKTDPGPGIALLGAVKLDGKKLLEHTALPDLTGSVRRLDGLLGPEGLVALFVDTTCQFSAQALREIPNVSRTLSGRKINSVVINLDDAQAAVKAFYANLNTGTPVLYDASPDTRGYWNIRAVPTAVYIDPDKKIAYNGKAVWGDLALAIERARKLAPGSIQFTAQGTRFG